jgi:hypothetical protein
MGQHIPASSANSQTNADANHPSRQVAQPFSDGDVDSLLTKLGIKPSENARLAARFLMRNHFQLSRPLMDLALKLLPQGPWENHGPAEALTAALSRLPLEKADAGFKILLASFSSRHPTIMSILHQVVGQLDDLMSAWLVQPESGLPSELFMNAMKEELSQWKSLLSQPKLQVMFLLMKGDLVKDLRRSHLMIQSLSRLLAAYGSRAESSVMAQLSILQKELRHAIDIMLGDMILSRDDQDHHFKEDGQCSTLGIWSEGARAPARLWADGDSELDDQEDPAWWFKFHWNDEHMGRLEAELQMVGTQGELQFLNDRAMVRACLDEHREDLDKRFNGMGFEIEQLPTDIITPEITDAEAELRSNSSGPLHHIDSKA